MKKLFLIILLIVAAGAAFRVLKGPGQKAAVSPTPSDIQTYTLAVLSDAVSVKSSGSQEFHVASGQSEVRQGDEIKTDAQGRAKLLYPNGAITTIEAGTHIKIESLGRNGDQSRLTLLVGSLWSKVKNVLGAGDYYEIETENTVASVRGTIFATEFRNRRSRVIGIDGKIRAQARDPVKKRLIEGAETEITGGEETAVDSQKMPGARQALAKAIVASEDLRGKLIKQNMVELSREDLKDFREERSQNFVKRVRDANADDSKFIDTMIKNRLIDAETQSSSPTPSSSPLNRSPSLSPLKLPLLSPLLKPSPTPNTTLNTSPSPTISSPTPTPTPNKPVVRSITPKTASPGATIAINGEGFMIGRNAPQVSGAALGLRNVSFAVIDGLTVFVDVPSDITLGTYDVELTTTGGDKLVLPKALIVQ